MANASQLWTKRLIIDTYDRAVALPFAADDPSESTLRFADTPCPIACTLKNFRVDADAAPGMGCTKTYTVWKNGSATDLTVTLAGLETTNTIPFGTTLSVDYLDRLSLRITGTGAAAAAGWTYSIECVPTVSGERAYGGGCLDFMLTPPDGIGKINPFFPRRGTWGDESLPEYDTDECLIGQAGTITKVIVRYQFVMADGEYEFVVWKRPLGGSPVRQDGSGGTVDTRFRLNVASGALDDFSYAVGNINLHCDPLERVFVTSEIITETGDTGFRGRVCLKFVADDHSKFFLSGQGGELGAVNTYFFPPVGGRVAVDTDEATQIIRVGPFGISGARFTAGYAEVQVAPVGGARAFAIRDDGEDSNIVFSIVGAAISGNGAGDLLLTEGQGFAWRTTPSGAPDEASIYWFTYVGTSETVEGGIIGPLAWVHWPRRIPGSPAEIVVDSFSDMDMQCPASWENGFKEGLVTRWGDAERPASHLFTGEWQGSTFSFQIADKQGRFRAQAASVVDRYWTEALTVRMTTRANRARYGRAFTAFSGPIIEAQPTAPLLWDITLGDVVSQGLLSDRAQVPWRVIRDSFLSNLSAISDQLDRDAPEPIYYGKHTRAADEATSPDMSEAFRVKPIYLGIWNIGGTDRHVWMVCGHAVKAIETYIDGVHFTENFGAFHIPSSWWIPHQADWQAQFGAPYVDIESDTYPGTFRRCTLIFGRTGRTGPDDCATGDRELTAAVWGIETEGDGTGELITDRFDQYQHFLINYVANQGPQSYQSGAWLANPTWDIFDGPVEKVDEASFAAAKAIGEDRLIGGYVGAAAIGAGPGDRASAKKWIADWNRSCACRFGINHYGQMHIFLVRPTEAIKAAAPLYTDAYEILDGSFATELKWDEHATSIPFVADFHQSSGEWKTNGVVSDAEAIENYGRDIPSETREYPFAPGLEQAEHLALLESRIRKHRPIYIRLDATIGPDPVTDDSLGYRDQGDYIRYVSFDAVSETRSERLAQVITPIVRVEGRRAAVLAMDVEDLIDYDLESSPSP